MSDLVINKTYTSNPFVDYLLYYTKLLAFGSVVKDDDTADRNETEASMMAGDILISCVENSVMFELFSYTKDDLIDVGITDPVLIKQCLLDKNNIPLNKRDAITEIGRVKYIEKYEELNPYYRKICGLPPIEDYGIPIRDYEYNFVDNTNPWNVTYIHELPHDAIMYLEQKGILNKIRMDYPDAEYLDYITCNITPYIARKAYDYQLLYHPEADKNKIVEDKFVRKYEENRLFVMATFYSEGLKLTSEYYSNFIGMLIMIMTMTDMLSEIPEHIVKRDLLDKRCIQFIFEMYGIPYYNSIPIKYQYRMCKNINSLIRYKSCAQGMLNLIDLFGAENIEVFKYFILRDRNTDKWGDMVYNQIEDTEISTNDIIDHRNVAYNNSYSYGSIIDIPFPIEDFLEKKNVMVVWGDGIRLKEDIDYTINAENQLVLNKDISESIRFDFYFNNNSGSSIDTENGLYIKCETKLISDRTFSFTPPYNSYIVDGNDIIVTLGGAILGPDQYTINGYNNTITLDPSFTIGSYTGAETVNDRKVSVIFLYAKNISTKYKKTNVTATVNNQTTFSIPEPFQKYIENENAFFITYRNTFIQNDRYIVDTDSNTITFTDIRVPLGIDVVFYFVYAEASTYQEVVIERKDVVLTVTEDYQTVFSLLDEDGNSLFPFDNPKYLSTPYKIYVRARDYDRMLDQDYYDIYSRSLVLRDTTLCLMKGETITVTFVYGPHETMKSLDVTKNNIYSVENYQSEFDIPIPIDGFFSEYNGAVIIDVYGNYLDPEDYIIDEANKKLTITNLDKRPAANEKLNLTFIRNLVTQNNIVIDQQFPDIGLSYNGKPRFNISLPFSNYFESGQTALLFHNSVLIGAAGPENDENCRVHYAKESVDSINVYFLYVDDTLSEYQSTDSVVVMFIYNGLYVRILEENITELSVEKDISEIIDDDLVLTIPYPFSKYLNNGWYLYITDEDNNIVYRSDNDESSEEDREEYPCEIINNELRFLDPSVIPEYERLTFNFTYYDSDNYIKTVYTEDYDNNYSLKFVGVPLSQEYHNREIMQNINVSPYDSITLEDQFWDGVAYNRDKNELHRKVKAEILRKKFNYERTKYFGINYVINIAEMAFRISYFYNMLYDKYFIEDNLNIKVPSIAPYKSFNIAHLFCYMTSLTYLFSGVEDYIINQFSTLLYIKGFNFGADLDTLKKWLVKQFRYIEDYPVWNFITTKEQLYGDSDTTKEYIDNHVIGNTDPVEFDDLTINGETITDGNQQIKDMDTFIDIYKNNRDIYDMIVKTIYDSADYDIYSIWKKMYDSLMIIDFNDTYYRVTLTEDGNKELGYDSDDMPKPGEEIVARTFKELLYYKDQELYNDIKYIKNLPDEIQRNDTIIDRISDIVYILEDWMDTDEFRNIYDTFPGVSGDSLVNYLFTIINFFKSYKVVLRSKGDYIVFTADDPLLNTIKIIDVKDTHADLEKHEYFDIEEYLDTGIYQYKDDRVFVKDKMSFDVSVTDGIDNRYSDVKVKYPDYPYKFTATSKIRVKRTTNQYITIFTSNGESFTTNVNSGWISAVKPDASGIIGMITYFNPFINDSDSSHPFMKLKVLDESLDLDSTEQYIVLDYGFPPELLSKFKTQVNQSGTSTDHRHVLIRESDPESDYIEFEVPYGTEFYVYITPSLGWHAGVLNIRYGKIFDDDMIIEATDATTIMRELNIHQSAHQHISLYNSIGEITDQSTLVPYGSRYFYTIDADEGYIPGEINIVPEEAVIDNMIEVIQTTDISASSATIKTFRVKIEAPAHENIALNVNGGTIFVEAGTSEELYINYWTEYSLNIYSFEQYTAGTPNIPMSGQFTAEIQQEEGYIYITTTEPTLNEYTITVQQSSHQVITVHYGDQSYSDDGSFTVTINTHITCTIHSDDGYIAGVLNITETYVNEDLIIYASEAVESEQLLITIDPKNNQTITVVCNGESYTEDFYVPFGSAYSSYITPNQGYTTNASIVNDRSEELRNNVVVYATEDAIPNMNTVTVVNPDPVHQTLRVYINEDQSEEHIKTDTFDILSGNMIRAEIESIDEDYIAGTLNITDAIIVVSDVDIIATAHTNINNIPVTVDTVPNETIDVTYEGNHYTSGDSFIALAGTTAYTTITPSTGYELTNSKFVPSYTFIKNGLPVTITSDYPILKGCIISIEQKQHQLISVTGTARIYHDDGTYEEIDNYTTTGSNTSFIYSTVFTASITADPGYEPGILNISAGTVDDDIVISATDPTPIEV